MFSKSTEKVVLQENDAADWVYRGEGNANLVLAYRGPSPYFAGKVLRIQKYSLKKVHTQHDAPVLSPYERLLWKDAIDLVNSPTAEIAEQRYVHHVMSPLLGPNHVDAGVQISVSEEFLESVEKNVSPQRPAWRLDAAKVNTFAKHALLISDHSLFLPSMIKGKICVSVEIKPKCGFLPSSRFITEHNAVKKSVTRFRMHQFLKLYKKEILQISKYDPLDLFSGSKTRICKSINDLLATPQNNLRIFLNGRIIFGNSGNESIVTSDSLDDDLVTIIHAERGMCKPIFVDLVSEAILKSDVLNSLLEVQKLDTLDIEGAIHAYYDVLPQSCTICKELEGISSNIYTDLHSICFEESLQIVRNYLIATTAKDCSFMLTFGHRDKGDSQSLYDYIHLESTNQDYCYKAKLIDLDMKAISKMEFYYELDQKIVRNYMRMSRMKDENEAAKACVYELNSYANR